MKIVRLQRRRFADREKGDPDAAEPRAAQQAVSEEQQNLLVDEADAARAASILGAPPVAELEEQTWKCPDCGVGNAAANAYCFNCGRCGHGPCPKCQQAIRVGVKYCPHCGVDINMKRDKLLGEFEQQLAEFAECEQESDARRAVGIVKALRKLELDTAFLPNRLRVACEAAKTWVRDLLEQQLCIAVVGHDVEAADTAIQQLKDALGDDMSDHASTVIVSFKVEQRRLETALARADIAMENRLLARALDELQNCPKWDCGALGEKRRDALIECRQRLRERDRRLGEADRLLDQKQYVEALAALEQLQAFSMPHHTLNVGPAEADLLFEGNQTGLHERLALELIDTIRTWMAADRWEAVSDVADALQTSDLEYATSLLADLKHLLDTEATKLFKKAMDTERSGDLALAEQAWRDLLRVPRTFIPSSRLHTAMHFSERQSGTSPERHDSVSDETFALCTLLWFCAVAPLVGLVWEVLAAVFVLPPDLLRSHLAVVALLAAVLAGKKTAQRIAAAKRSACAVNGHNGHSALMNGPGDELTEPHSG